MATLTSSKDLKIEKDMVLVSRREYEDLLSLKKIIPIVAPTAKDRRDIARARTEIKTGKCVPWSVVKNELAHRNHSNGK